VSLVSPRHRACSHLLCLPGMLREAVAYYPANVCVVATDGDTNPSQDTCVSFRIEDPYFLVENEKLIFYGLARKTRENWGSRSFTIGAQRGNRTAHFGVALT